MIDVYECEVTEDTINDIGSLLEHHSSELGYGDVDIDVKSYVALYDIGMLKLYVAELNNTKVGYICYIISNSLNNKSVKTATQNGLFVSKANRGAMIALKLISYADYDIKEKYNVDYIMQPCNVKNDIYPLMKRLGYTEYEKVYKKEF